MKNINEQIQESQRIEKIYSGEIDKLPTMFWVARRFREGYKGLSKNISDEIKENYSEIRGFNESLEFWAKPFQLLIFEKTELNGKKKLSFLRKTKRNLRFELRNHKKLKRVDFKVLGTIDLENGKIKRPFEKIDSLNFLAYGTASTQMVYSNPIIQSFFEFSLNYSYTKHIELTYEKAKRIFLKACRSSFDLALNNEIETQKFNEFLNFLYEGTGFFNSSNLPSYEAGRPSKPLTETEKAIILAKAGNTNRQISEELNPKLRGANRTKDVARIGRNLRRNGFGARNRKKTRP